MSVGNGWAWASSTARPERMPVVLSGQPFWGDQGVHELHRCEVPPLDLDNICKVSHNEMWVLEQSYLLVASRSSDSALITGTYTRLLGTSGPHVHVALPDSQPLLQEHFQLLTSSRILL